MNTTTDKREAQSVSLRERWTRFYREVLTEHLIWPIVIVMILVGSTVPGFLTTGNFLNVLWGAASLGLMTLGLYFVLITGRLDLSLESTLVFAPTIAVLLMVSWAVGFNPVLALVVALGVGAAVGLTIGALSHYANVNPFLITLGMLLTLRGLVVYLIPEGIYNIPEAFTWLGRTRIGEVPVASVVLLFVFVVAYLVMRYTYFGKAITALGNNEQATRVAGVNVNLLIVGVFVVAGLLAALGGIIEVGRLNSVDASMGEGRILVVFAAATLGGTALTGGRGRVSGVFGAVLVISGITNLMNLIGIPTALQQVMFGAILLLAILLSSVQDSLRKRWSS